MYGVVAKWEFDPEVEPELRSLSAKAHEEMRTWPGIESIVDIKIAPGAILSVILYSDEASYQRLIHDPEGPFEAMAKKYELERYARWIWSERGEAF